MRPSRRRSTATARRATGAAAGGRRRRRRAGAVGVTVAALLAAGTTTPAAAGPPPPTADTDAATEGLGPELSLRMSVDRLSARAGEEVRFEVTVTNTGGVVLHDVVVGDTLTGCDQSIGTLGVALDVTVQCVHTPTVDERGSVLANIATADSAETDPVETAPIEVTVTWLHQPDLDVARASGPTAGTDLYGRDPTSPSQVATASRRRNGRVTFVVRIVNDGDDAASFDLRRLDAAPGLLVRLTEARANPDITARVDDRTYRTRVLQPGGVATIAVEVTVAATAPRRQTQAVTLRTRAMAEPRQVDTVRAEVFVH